MFKKMCVNVAFVCVAFLSAVVAVNCPPLAGAQGVESLSVPSADQSGIDSYTKLMLHADGSDQGTSFTDSSSGAKTVTNTETYDSYTKLMLHMEGIGNSFTDSAASKAVTANGDATQTTAQYKLGSKSAVLDGSGDYLSLADSDDWNLGNNADWTVDTWFKSNSASRQAIVCQGTTNTNLWQIDIGANGAVNIFAVQTTYTFDKWTGSTNLMDGSWHHLAVVHTSSSNTYVFVDGVSQAVTTGNTGENIPDFSASLYIGTYYDGSTYPLNGYIDELRISKGIARWTSNFTPPSSPYGKVYTVTGTKKFGTASGEFKGSGEYLSLADSDDWNFGSGDFTIDFWVRFADLSVHRPILEQRNANTDFWGMYWSYTQHRLIFYSTSSSVEVGKFKVDWLPSLNTWYHVVVVRNGNTPYIFIGGTSLSIITETAIGSNSLPNVATSATIGYSIEASAYMQGHLDEFRISKGIARWTSNFTPPTAPYDVDTTPPTVSSTSPASNSTGVGVSSAISATFNEDMDSSTITTSTFTLTSSSGSSISGTVSYSNKTATFTPSSSLSYSTTYTATITTGVKDSSGNAMSSNYTWSFTTGSAPDTTVPSGSVSINGGASYTNSTAVTLTLTATDSVGVVGYYTSTSSSTPVASASGWNSVTSATSYSGSVSYTLTSGDEQKTVYVWYKDSAGNVSSSASDSITLDTTAPIVTITSPTSSDTYTATSSTVSLSGSASDTTSGVSKVTWSNDKGGSGDASGTTYWSISSISLSSGVNKITVTAKDNAGNTSTDTITVTYNAGSAPTVTTGSASNVTATQATLTGTVNAKGLSTTTWFEYSTISGSYTNKSSTQTVTGSNDTTVSIAITGLTSGTTYYYKIVAENNAGKSEGSEMSFQYTPGGSAPTVTTDSATDVTTTTATLNGKVNANGISTTAWFEYGAQSGSYGNKSNTKSVTGSTDTTVSASISGLTAGTTYYYRIAAQNSVGTSYGKEMSFYYTSQTEPPTVTTEAATDVTSTTATLNGEVNPNSQSTTVWFEYGVLSGTYKYKTSTQSKSGSSYTKVSAAITGLTAGTTYYYRIAAKNSAGTSYGEEMEFYKSPDGTTTTPTPNATQTPGPTPTQTATPAPTTTPIPAGKGSVFGYVKDPDENALQGVGVSISGNGYSDNTETDNRGYYEFRNLEAGSYTLTYEEDGYKTQTKGVTLGEGEANDLGTVILEEEGEETVGKIYGYVVDIRGEPIESVRVRLKGIKTKVKSTESSDADGFFEFSDLGADTYVLTAKKKRYRNSKQNVTLEDGESEEVEIEMRKTNKRIKGLIQEEDVQ